MHGDLTATDAIHLRVGCEFLYAVSQPSPALFQVAVRRGEQAVVVRETWQVEPAAGADVVTDLYGNSLRRVALPAGEVHVRYDARVRVPAGPDPQDAGAPQHPVLELPPEALHYLLASRYCPSDLLRPTAWELFGALAPGWTRAQSVSDWVHRSIEFQYGASDPATTAQDVLERRRGVCRDFAHLFIAFCRGLDMPARYVFGYLPDLFVEPSPDPMDFCAWAEVYLGGRWWTFDPRNNEARAGRVVIGRGRDAMDVAMATTWGPADFSELTVWAGEVPE